jgi:hypothetical protein
VKHPWFNEPGFGGWEGTETETTRKEVGHTLGSASEDSKQVEEERKVGPQVRRFDESGEQ